MTPYAWRIICAILSPIIATVIILLIFGPAARAARSKPGVLVYCESGGVNKREGYIASGHRCVLHDNSGGQTSAENISIYDDSVGP